MKRLVLVLFLVGVSGALAHAVFVQLRPAQPQLNCEIKWLSGQLGLTPAQHEAIYALHQRYCRELYQLKATLARVSPAEAARVKQDYRRANEQLIDAVYAQLTPVQREKYLQLVAACRQKAEPSSGN